MGIFGEKYSKTPSVCLISYIVCNLIIFSCKSNIHTHDLQKAIYDLSCTCFLRSPAKMIGNNFLYLLDSYNLYKLVLYILM